MLLLGGAAAQAPPGGNQQRILLADAGGPYATAPGRNVLLSATRSTAPDGELPAFAWDFGDGSSATGPSPIHRYDAAGTYTVTLLATAGKNDAVAATTRVIVADPSPGNRPPLAVDNGPYVGLLKQDIVFDASGSTDPDGDTLGSVWMFGDGTSEVGPTVLHAYLRAGTYTVSLLVTDGKGGACSRTTTAIVGPAASRFPNRPPLALGTGPAKVWAGEPATFSARESRDPDGDPLTFVWTFDDGDSATEVAPTHIFATPGTHTVRLTASDGRGGQSTTFLQIAIDRTEGNEAPIPAIGGPYAGVVGSPVTFDASESREPDGDDLTFAWDFGDGTKGSGAMLEHAYTKPGTFPVSVLVSDDNGNAVKASTHVVISSAPGPGNELPVAKAGGPYRGSAGTSVTFDGRLSMDPDGDELAYAWSFGDGTTGTGSTVAHTYAGAGTYTVLLLITDGKGGSASASAVATIGGR